MSSANLDLVIHESAVDTVANLAKSPAKTQKPITSSSAVPLVTEEVYPFRLVYPPLLAHTDAISVCRAVTSRAC